MNELESKLAELRARYFKNLPDRARVLREAVQAWRKSKESQTLSEVASVAHTLAGSGTTFGLPQVSSAAMLLERLALRLTSPGAQIQAAHEDQLDSLVAELEALAAHPEEASQPVSPPVAGGASSERVPVIIVEDDLDLARFLSSQLEPLGYLAHHVRSIGDLAESAARIKPAAIIMDMHLKGLPAPGQIAEPGERLAQPVPILFISAEDSLTTRLHAVAAGGAAFFAKPLDIDALVEQLDAITRQNIELPYRVLVMDDDAILGDHLALTLETTNIKALAVHQPEEFLNEVVRFEPELIIMDLHLGEYSGLELAQVIEQHERFFATPIIFLSTESDLGMRFKALASGGENYLTKPITSERLIRTVFRRVRRARQTIDRVRRDGMTGLLTHGPILAALNRELAKAREKSKPLAIAMVDLDHFKAVNDQHGHPAGDMVLRRFARLLKSSGFANDLAGRYGGEEFLLLMPDMSAADAREILDNLRAEFGGLSFESQKVFYCSFSAGIASAKNNESCLGLVARADAALYEAKKNGRARTEVSE